MLNSVVDRLVRNCLSALGLIVAVKFAQSVIMWTTQEWIWYP